MEKRIKECLRIYNELNDKILKLEEELEKEYDKDIEEEINRLDAKRDDFVWNEFSKVVFEVYSVKKPRLVDVYSKEILKWEDVFGSDFSRISKKGRENLVGLIVPYGRYRIKSFF